MLDPTRLYESYVTTHTAFYETDLSRVTYFPVLNHLPDDRRTCIWDLGCGSGEALLELRARGYKNLHGVDISTEQVQRAKKAGLETVHQGDVFSVLRSVRDPVDVFLCNDIFEHLAKTDVLDLTDLVHKKLAPGGLLVGQTTNGISPIAGIYFHGDFTHETLLSPESLRQVAMAIGFEDFEVFAIPPPVHGFKSLMRRCTWWVYNTFFSLCLASMTGRLRGHILTPNFLFVATKSQE